MLEEEGRGVILPLIGSLVSSKTLSLWMLYDCIGLHQAVIMGLISGVLRVRTLPEYLRQCTAILPQQNAKNIGRKF